MIDFLISNERHHVAIMRPLVREMTAQGYPCRVVSFCELRGVATPVDAFAEAGAEVRRVVKWQWRRTPATGQQKGGFWAHQKRRLAREVVWQAQLRSAASEILSEKPPRLVVTANDAAFPYNRYCGMLRRRRIPFVLLQEGVRFTLPAAGEATYGQSGASAIAAWGAASANYFEQVGVPKHNIALTGTPQFDSLRPETWRTAGHKLRAEMGLGRKVLLLLTNPIDDQGFCTTAEKMTLVRDFVTRLAPLFAAPDFSLVVKLHAREALTEYRKLWQDLPFASRIVATQTTPLYPLLALSQAATVMTSTAGLEAMLFGLPLSVLELPHGGFGGDYVHTGAACALALRANVAARVQSWLARPTAWRKAAGNYLAANLATRTSATPRIAALLAQQAAGSRQQAAGRFRVVSCGARG